jgi:hypothetical protein
MDAINRLGYTCTGLFFTTPPLTSIKVKIIKWHVIKLPLSRWFFQLKIQHRMAKAIYETLKVEHSKYDLIYIRYFGLNFYVYKLAKLLKNKLVIESQTNGRDEIYATLDQIKNKRGLDKWLSYIQYFAIPLLQNALYKNVVFKSVRAVVAPTYEIADSIKKQFINTKVLSNGISDLNIEVCTPKIFEKKLRALFLKGSIGDLDYDGIDRIIESIVYYGYEDKIAFNIYGEYNEQQMMSWDKHKFVILHAPVFGKALNMAINANHFGFGTMAPYRKGLNELSALKARQYYLSGLPFVYCGIDTDITGNVELERFVMNVSNNQEMINLPIVYEWFSKMSKIDNYPNFMHQLALEHLGWDAKMQKLLNELE